MLLKTVVADFITDRKDDHPGHQQLRCSEDMRNQCVAERKIISSKYIWYLKLVSKHHTFLSKSETRKSACSIWMLTSTLRKRIYIVMYNGLSSNLYSSSFKTMFHNKRQFKDSAKIENDTDYVQNVLLFMMLLPDFVCARRLRTVTYRDRFPTCDNVK